MTRNFRTRGEILQLLKIVEDAGLNTPPGFEALPVGRIQECYNGIGADWQSNLSRAAITGLREFFEPVALVHDVVGDLYNDGTAAGAREWNKKYWLENGRKLACYRYRWYDPRRWIQLRRNWVLYEFLETFGARAWREAYVKRPPGGVQI